MSILNLKESTRKQLLAVAKHVLKRRILFLKTDTYTYPNVK